MTGSSHGRCSESDRAYWLVDERQEDIDKTEETALRGASLRWWLKSRGNLRDNDLKWMGIVESGHWWEGPSELLNRELMESRRDPSIRLSLERIRSKSLHYFPFVRRIFGSRPHQAMPIFLYRTSIGMTNH